ncbi:TPA: hypothetical protein OVQ53_002540 [Staphylococcus aureus]|nr:hypothetical protein [Staphylococcus aureus]HCV1626167.1 hypothetical protein [Staphylococcus aureus]
MKSSKYIKQHGLEYEEQKQLTLF